MPISRLKIGIVFTAILGVAIPQSLNFTKPSSFIEEAEQVATGYGISPPHDAIAALNVKLQSHAAQLRFEGPSGYLRSVLSALDIPIESQIAVFSKTSLQAPIISPRNP